IRAGSEGPAAKRTNVTALTAISSMTSAPRRRARNQPSLGPPSDLGGPEPAGSATVVTSKLTFGLLLHRERVQVDQREDRRYSDIGDFGADYLRVVGEGLRQEWPLRRLNLIG